MKVIMKAREIPLGSTITKIRGAKEYIINDRIRIFDTEFKEIKSSDGARFITSGNADINVVSCDSELVWHVEPRALIEYLETSEEDD